MVVGEDFRGFEHLYDGRVVTEDGFEFPVHRALLALKSKYFHDVLCNTPVKEKDILVPRIQGSTMQIVINHIYNGELNVRGRDILDILVAACFLGIENLLTSSRYSAIRSLATTNCIPLFLAASKNEKLGILKACARFIGVNFQGIVRNQDSGIEDLPADSFQRLLALDTLNVSSEDQIWEAIVMWVGKVPEIRGEYLNNFITNIRFCNARDGLATEILNHPLVKEHACYDELKRTLTSRHRVFRHRIPDKFFVITKICTNRLDYSEGIQIFATWDDRVDFWKHVSSKVFRPDVVLHGRGPLVVMFDTETNSICSFDVASRTWSTFRPLSIPRRKYSVVKVGSHIYVLGGISPLEEVITTVERYDFDAGRWEYISFFFTVRYCKRSYNFALSEGAAVAMNGTICIVGTINGSSNEVYIYKIEADTWHSISAPKVFRSQFALVVYQNQLFVLGGHSGFEFSKSVEVYSAEDDQWRHFPDLPFPYFWPKAVIIEDVLYVYENSSDYVHDVRCPPVLWDWASDKWEVVEASSPFFDLHLYQFCTIEDPSVIMDMRREIRDAKWDKSPFFPYLNG